MSEEIFVFFKTALAYCRKNFENELYHVQSLDFKKTTPEHFLREFIFVVLSAGMKNQAVDAWFKRIWNDGNVNPEEAKNHELKYKAIIEGLNNHIKWFDILKSLKTDRERIEYLGTLPFIGKITKYHLGRNIGIDCAKPDRWLVRISEKFNFETPRGMCEYISEEIGLKLGVVDVVLWRYCNMNPKCLEQYGDSD